MGKLYLIQEDKENQFTMTKAIDITSSTDDIPAILAVAKRFEGVEGVSEPTALDASKALNAGVTLDTFREALVFITIVFKTTTAALAFLKALREEIKARGTAAVVSETTSGKTLGKIESGTTDQDIQKFLAT